MRKEAWTDRKKKRLDPIMPKREMKVTNDPVSPLQKWMDKAFRLEKSKAMKFYTQREWSEELVKGYTRDSGVEVW